ncbi:2-amino-4-hydroxy-6-hydroxymethyldihydropteridine diphosphokinase [Silanimonas sp.]|uniref:2-amino-4-hydroxy-6- hydroxymethyldihydropteridine diphosphokinase n=1 Tax=Silanimonas sp. TaxID=1929290 RepID=UPI001BC25DB0|nr:2-amino-4-hydroxy-6-hydroxymethyldihydropteridine diphosphokinase [Silanimonas sp.]MBS3896359.1 2-amino-4-hydroxy-6-hydroxymethyldihydropteridine diphosphokinase [Silanimonas sp.]
MMTNWLLVLGSNVDGQMQLCKAVSRLKTLGEVRVLVKPITTVAEPPGSPAYCNGLVVLCTDVADLSTLDTALKAIEAALGRDRSQSDRVAMDIDVLALGVAGGWQLTCPARSKADLAKTYVSTLLQAAGVMVVEGIPPSP